MKLLTLLVFVFLTACVANPHPLTHTNVDDPIWTINPDRWQGENALTTAPTLQGGRIATPMAATR